jgi:hypothetical protein
MIKKVSMKSAFITGLVLMSSMSFIDASMQIRPEGLDLLLYPLILLMILSVKKKSFIVMALVSVYSHGVAGLSNIYGLAIKLLKENKWRKIIAVGLIVIIPMLIVSAYYIKGAFETWFSFSGTNYNTFNYPLTMIPLYSGLTLVGFLYLFNRNKSYFESLLSYGIVGSMVMIPFWLFRWLGYVSVPLSMLVGIHFNNVPTKSFRLYSILFVMFYCAYVALMIITSITYGWSNAITNST